MALIGNIQLQNGSVTPVKLDTSQTFNMAGLTASNALAVSVGGAGISTSGLLTMKSAGDICTTIQTTNTNGNIVNYYNNDSDIFWATRVSGSASDGFFITNDNDGEQYTALAITKTGQSAFGTSSPSTTNILELSANNSASAGLKVTNATDNTAMEIRSEASSGSIGTVTNSMLGLRTNSVTHMCIKTDGTVCIPNLVACLAGGSSGATQWVTSGDNIYYDSGEVSIGTNNHLRTFNVYHATNDPVALFESGDAHGLIEFKDNNTSSNGQVMIGACTDAMVFYTSGTKNMVLGDGKIALGIATNLGTVDISNNNPTIYFHDANGGAANACIWRIKADASVMSIGARSSDDLSGENAIQITRSDAAITKTSFPEGVVCITDGMCNAGTFTNVGGITAGSNIAATGNITTDQCVCAATCVKAQVDLCAGGNLAITGSASVGGRVAATTCIQTDSCVCAATCVWAAACINAGTRITGACVIGSSGVCSGSTILAATDITATQCVKAVVDVCAEVDVIAGGSLCAEGGLALGGSATVEGGKVTICNTSNVCLVGSTGGTYMDIFMCTSDASDSKILRIGAGGNVQTTRGAYILFGGNEATSYEGALQIYPGCVCNIARVEGCFHTTACITSAGYTCSAVSVISGGTMVAAACILTSTCVCATTCVQALKDLCAGANLKVGGIAVIDACIQSATCICAGTCIVAADDITSGGKITSGTRLISGSCTQSTTCVCAGTCLVAAQDVIAGGQGYFGAATCSAVCLFSPIGCFSTRMFADHVSVSDCIAVTNGIAASEVNITNAVIGSCIKGTGCICSGGAINATGQLTGLCADITGCIVVGTCVIASCLSSTNTATTNLCVTSAGCVNGLLQLACIRAGDSATYAAGAIHASMGTTNTVTTVARFGTGCTGNATGVRLQFVEDEDQTPSEIGTLIVRGASHASGQAFVFDQLLCVASSICAGGDVEFTGHICAASYLKTNTCVLAQVICACGTTTSDFKCATINSAPSGANDVVPKCYVDANAGLASNIQHVAAQMSSTSATIAITQVTCANALIHSRGETIECSVTASDAVKYYWQFACAGCCIYIDRNSSSSGDICVKLSVIEYN